METGKSRRAEGVDTEGRRWEKGTPGYRGYGEDEGRGRAGRGVGRGEEGRALERSWRKFRSRGTEGGEKCGALGSLELVEERMGRLGGIEIGREAEEERRWLGGEMGGDDFK